MSKEEFLGRVAEDAARRANREDALRYMMAGDCHGCNHKSITKRMKREKRKFYR